MISMGMFEAQYNSIVLINSQNIFYSFFWPIPFHPHIAGKKPMANLNSQSRILLSICEVRPNLFIAGYTSIEESKLRQLGITHCVDATNLPKPKQLDGIEYLSVPIDDSMLANVGKYFQSVADFARNAQQKGGKTVIYCSAGVSRAATLTIMTLVINEGMSLREAYYTVVRIRPIIAPNLSFWRQMIAWEVEKNGQSTVRLLKGMRTPVPDVYLHKSDYMPPPETWNAPPKYTLTPTMGRRNFNSTNTPIMGRKFK